MYANTHISIYLYLHLYIYSPPSSMRSRHSAASVDRRDAAVDKSESPFAQELALSK